MIDPVTETRQPEDRVRRAHALSPRFYDAAIDPGKWPAVLEDLREMIGAEIAQVNVVRPDDIRVHQTFWAGASEDIKRAYLAYQNHAQDPRAPIISHYPYRPMHCRQVVTDAEWYSSEIYRNLLGPFGYDYSLLYTAPSDNGKTVSVLALVRHHDSGAFSDDDLAHLSLYVPHLRRAFEIMARLIDGVSGQHVFSEVFERVEAAVLITDRFGEPKHVNPAARALLSAQTHLTDANGPLCAMSHRVTEALRADILEVGLAGLDGCSIPPIKRTLPGRDGAPPLVATISPLAGIGARTGGVVPEGAIVGVFITDPRQPFETNTEHLQRIFGLTNTEATILDELIAKGSTRRLAESTGRGYETVRKHVKVIREKLGAKTQADLVRIAAEMRWVQNRN